MCLGRAPGTGQVMYFGLATGTVEAHIKVEPPEEARPHAYGGIQGLGVGGGDRKPGQCSKVNLCTQS